MQARLPSADVAPHVELPTTDEAVHDPEPDPPPAAPSPDTLARTVASVAHDLNNILATISMTSQWLAHGLAATTTPSVREGFVTIDEGIDRASTLLRRLLVLSIDARSLPR